MDRKKLHDNRSYISRLLRSLAQVVIVKNGRSSCFRGVIPRDGPYHFELYYLLRTKDSTSVFTCRLGQDHRCTPPPSVIRSFFKVIKNNGLSLRDSVVTLSPKLVPVNGRQKESQKPKKQPPNDKEVSVDKSLGKRISVILKGNTSLFSKRVLFSSSFPFSRNIYKLHAGFRRITLLAEKAQSFPAVRHLFKQVKLIEKTISRRHWNAQKSFFQRPSSVTVFKRLSNSFFVPLPLVLPFWLKNDYPDHGRPPLRPSHFDYPGDFDSFLSDLEEWKAEQCYGWAKLHYNASLSHLLYLKRRVCDLRSLKLFISLGRVTVIPSR